MCGSVSVVVWVWWCGCGSVGVVVWCGSVGVVVLARLMFGQGEGGLARQTTKKQKLLSPSHQFTGIPMKSVQHRPR